MESYTFFVSGSRQKSRTRTGPGFSALFSRHNFHHTKGNRNRGRELLAFMRCKRFLPWLGALGALEMASLGYAQDPQQGSSSKPSDAAAPSAAKKSGKPGQSYTCSHKNCAGAPEVVPLHL